MPFRDEREMLRNRVLALEDELRELQTSNAQRLAALRDTPPHSAPPTGKPFNWAAFGVTIAALVLLCAALLMGIAFYVLENVRLVP